MRYLKVIAAVVVPFALLFADQQEKPAELEDLEIVIKWRCPPVQKGIFELTYEKGAKKAKVAVDTTELKRSKNRFADIVKLEAEGEVDRDKVLRSLKKWEKQGLFKLKDLLIHLPSWRFCRCPVSLYKIEASWGEKENSFEFFCHNHGDKELRSHRTLTEMMIKFIKRWAKKKVHKEIELCKKPNRCRDVVRSSSRCRICRTLIWRRYMLCRGCAKEMGRCRICAKKIKVRKD
jgi:hypothetical protein